MALEQNTLFQLLTQLQGGGSPIRPTSGLDEPSLSGLRLGEQGMGLGGGGSLLGGSPGAGGGAEGPGLDFLTLLNQLTQGAGTAAAPGQSLLEGIGPSALGFGAGGALLPQPGGVPQGTLGQAGVGGGQSAATALALLKEAVGLGKTLGGFFKTASPTGGPGGTADILRGTGGPAELAGLEEFPAGAAGTSAPGGGTFSELGNILPPIPGFGGLTEFPAGAAGLPGVGGGTFSRAGNILPGLPSLGAEGATSGADLAAQFGAQGGGEFGLANLAGGGGTDLLSLGNVLPGLGVLGNLGSGILGLTQGNVAGGAGTLGGTAAGLGLGAALAPETFGLSLLLGGLGGSAGGLLGSLFGGFGSPSVFEARRQNVGPTAQAGESALAGALTPGLQSAQALLAALGVPTPDTFGSARNPVAVSLNTPQGPFEFNPVRAAVSRNPVTPELFSRFLEEVRGQLPAFQAGERTRQADFAKAVAQRQAEQAAFAQQLEAFRTRGLARGEAPPPDQDVSRFGTAPPDVPPLPPAFPPALSQIGGSGDVAFQDQGASEALAARVATTAKQAILNFLLGPFSGLAAAVPKFP